MSALAAIRVCVLLVFAAAALSPAAAAADARKDYMLQCQGCHMADGKGLRGSVPDLRGQLARYVGVPGGREYLVKVPGSAQSPLSNRELADVLNWMIRRFSSPEVSSRFTAFTAAEVGLSRKPLADVEAVRKILLERISSAEDVSWTSHERPPASQP